MYLDISKVYGGVRLNWFILLCIVYYVFYWGILDYSVLPIAGHLAMEK